MENYAYPDYITAEKLASLSRQERLSLWRILYNVACSMDEDGNTTQLETITDSEQDLLAKLCDLQRREN